MIAILSETVTWWHWIVLGIALIVIEMSTGTFFMLILGISAIMVGVIDLLIPISFQLQLLFWMTFSILAIAAWVKWFKDKVVSNSGQSDYRLDTQGVVTEQIKPHHRGKVRFDTPVLGNTNWHATAKIEIPKGTRIEIVEINGQLIEVAPLNQTTSPQGEN